MRVVRVFAVWLCAFFLLCVLYTAHRGVDWMEAEVSSPLFAALATLWWIRKRKAPSK